MSAVPVGQADAIDRLADSLQRKYRDRICAELTVPAQQARTEDLPDELLPSLRRALAARGVTRLY
ncbi:MAG: hypothetical protein KDI82_11135, partial [Gammaproteobacteria bacterium]|nr:hypothetical protein [Gammaproteobacteria bacterium]